MSSSFVIIFLCHFSQASVSIKISNLFVSVALICLEKYNFVENVYVLLSYLIK